MNCEGVECNVLFMLPGNINEPPGGKTNNVVSEQVRHKPVCAVTETGLKLEFSDLRRRISVAAQMLV